MIAPAPGPAISRAPGTALLAIRLFGPFDVRLGGEALPRLRSRKGEWLLALLVLRHGRDVERSWLAGLLWPDSPEPQALANLRISLTDLRHALGPEADRLRSPTPRTLSLDLTGAEADVVAFDAALARGDETALVEAVVLYRGPLLEGCVEEWAFEEREARQQAYLQALERRAAQALERGEPNGAAIAQVCHRLDGIPLTIELAAARVRVLPVATIAERLDDRFRLLTGGSRTAPRRQQTLRALIDWSYDLLTEEEQALLRRLSVFAGGWTLEAAEALREALHAPLTGVSRAKHERGVAATRAALGEEAFASAWAAGRQMSLEEAVNYAL